MSKWRTRPCTSAPVWNSLVWSDSFYCSADIMSDAGGSVKYEVCSHMFGFCGDSDFKLKEISPEVKSRFDESGYFKSLDLYKKSYAPFTNAVVPAGSNLELFLNCHATVVEFLPDKILAKFNADSSSKPYLNTHHQLASLGGPKICKK